MTTAIKGNLLRQLYPVYAQIIAGEINVRVKIGGRMAYCGIDPKNPNQRVINLPSLPLEDTQIAQAAFGYLYHEGFHALKSDFKLLTQVSGKPIRGHILNIIEDIWNENWMPKHFLASKQYIDAMNEFILEKGWYQVPTLSSKPAQVISAAVLYWGLGYYNNTKALKPLADETFDVLAQVLSKPGMTKFTALLSTFMPKIESSADCLDLTDRILTLLKEEEEALKEKANDQDDSSDQAADPGDSDDSDDSGSSSQSGDDSDDQSSGSDAQDEGSDADDDAKSDGSGKGSDDADSDEDDGTANSSGKGADTDSDSDDDADSDDSATGTDDDADSDDDADADDSATADSDDDADSDGDAGADSDDDSGNSNSESDAASPPADDSQETGGDSASSSSSPLSEEQAAQFIEQMLNSDDSEIPDHHLDSLAEHMSEIHQQEVHNYGSLEVSPRSLDPVNGNSALAQQHFSNAAAQSNLVRQRLARVIESHSRKNSSLSEQGNEIDRRRMPGVLTGNFRVFRDTQKAQVKTAAFHVLIDTSSSMNAPRMKCAMEASVAIGLALEKVRGANLAISHFPAHDSSTGSGESFRTLLHPKQRVASTLQNFGIASNGGTPMAQAMWGVAHNLLVQKEERKILMVITDGDPDDRQAVANFLETMKRFGVEVMAVGIQTNYVTSLFENSCVVNKLEELPNQLVEVVGRAYLAG